MGKTPELMRLADCAMSVSGSVSLELLYHTTPTVILYWIDRFAYFVQGFFRKVKYITLVNLLATGELDEGRDEGHQACRGSDPVCKSDRSEIECLFPEYLTCEDKSAEIAGHIIEWLTDPAKRAARVEALAELKAGWRTAGPPAGPPSISSTSWPTAACTTTCTNGSEMSEAIGRRNSGHSSPSCFIILPSFRSRTRVARRTPANPIRSELLAAWASRSGSTRCSGWCPDAGLQSGDAASVLTWIVAVFLSILVHELGHALVMRAYGFRPWITLYGLGGLASYDQGHAFRSKGSGPLGQILICLAGPAAGFLLAAVLVLGLVLAGYGDEIVFVSPWDGCRPWLI